MNNEVDEICELLFKLQNVLPINDIWRYVCKYNLRVTRAECNGIFYFIFEKVGNEK